MIDLNKYYISSEYQGASGGSEGRSGFVPKALSGDELKFLRGDGTWGEVQTTVSNIQYVYGEPVINLDVSLYDTFVIGVTGSTTVTYSNFVPGKSINVYLSALHTSYLPHTFPENTLFAELGDENIIYSFAGYTTRILLQNVGNFVINFSSITKNLSSESGGGGEGSGSGSGSDGGGVTGVGLDLLLLYLDEVFNL